MLSALLPLILGSTVLGNSITYNIYNKCPKPIGVAISRSVENSDSQTEKKLITLEAVTGKKTETNVNLMIARANEYDDTGILAAVFFKDFYSLSAGATHFNAGVRVKPDVSAHEGFCETVQCDGPGCPGATESILVAKDFPAESTSPPSPPFYRCPENPAFEVTFCPTGQYPGHDGLPIKFSNSDGQTKCLDVQGEVLANGTLVQLYECNNSGAQRWVISKERVQLAGTNYCLDAGTVAANGNQLKIWHCSGSALPAQEWIYTADRRVALKGQGFCMDVANGRIDGGKVQTWRCTDNNANQIWTSGH